MKIGIDIDGTVLTQQNFNSGHGTYHLAQPIPGAVEAVNRLYQDGHTVIFYTARHHLADVLLAKEQLEDFGIKYHHLVSGKPGCDVFIDDRAMTFEGDWQAIEDNLQRYQQAINKSSDSGGETLMTTTTTGKKLSEVESTSSVAVVILSYNQPEETSLLYANLIDQSSENAKIFVVECGTNKELVSKETTHWLNDNTLAKYGANPTARINAGLEVASRDSSYDYVWLVLSGTSIPSKNTLSEMVKVMNEAPQIGILQPNPLTWTRYTSASNVVTLYPRLDFCCWLIRREVLAALGPNFCDSQSFSGSWAEFDISARCYRAGWGLGVTGNVTFTEKTGASSLRNFSEDGYGWLRKKYGFDSEHPQLELKKLCQIAFEGWKEEHASNLPNNFVFSDIGYETPKTSDRLPAIGTLLAKSLSKVMRSTSQ